MLITHAKGSRVCLRRFTRYLKKKIFLRHL